MTLNLFKICFLESEHSCRNDTELLCKKETPKGNTILGALFLCSHGPCSEKLWNQLYYYCFNIPAAVYN